MAYKEILDRIAAKEKAAGCSGQSKLIAVSKVQPNERVAAVLDQGHRLFGENKVQEAAGKWPEFREKYGAVDVHLLGPLQTNKARQAMELFQAIHSLDRPKLANTLARLAQELGHCPDLFIQVNTGAEPQKAGILPEDADKFVETCRTLDLPVIGLMCIPPFEEPPAPHFVALGQMAKRNGLACLSMGMSGDFEEAIEHGATHIRVGSAIFGNRDYRA